MANPVTIYGIGCLNGETHWIASDLDLSSLYRMICADGYYALKNNEVPVAAIPFHAIHKVFIAPPEVLAAIQGQPQGSA